AITFTDELLPPPTVLLLAPSMSTPLSELRKAPVPAALVPMRLLTMLLLLAALVSKNMPFWLPEIRLRSHGTPPPTALWAVIIRPALTLGAAEVPAALVPMKLPAIVLPVLCKSIALLKFWRTSPFTRLFPPRSMIPLVLDGLLPTKTILSAALV